MSKATKKVKSMESFEVKATLTAKEQTATEGGKRGGNPCVDWRSRASVEV
jgi:hypothetical protein